MQKENKIQEVEKKATLASLKAGLAEVEASPRDVGRADLIVCRPDVQTRQTLTLGKLDEVEGLIGDNWLARGSRHTADGAAERGKQLTLMNTRVAQLVAGERADWPLAGDQLYVDFDLSKGNLSVGTRLRLGTAVVEVSAVAHTGCKKFSQRFGIAALQWVSSPMGRDLRLRGVYVVVVASGEVRVGDEIGRMSVS